MSPPAALPSRRKTNFLDLPEETQKEIFGHCRFGDLICLALVSRHFRDLAAEHLYHTIDIVFPIDTGRHAQGDFNELPLCLDTFATSDYDYASFLRQFSLDTNSTGGLAEIAYKNYHYSRSPGKFLNTLILVALRKARKLESLVWNVRIEISRPLYKVLHSIDTLVNVDIRLPAGQSLYEAPRKLPILPGSPDLSASASHSTTTTVTPMEHLLLQSLATQPAIPQHQFQQQQQQQQLLQQPSVGAFFGNSLPPSTLFPPAMPSNNPPPMTSLPHGPRARSSRHRPSPSDPPTISGFKNLKCLGVFEIDSLDIIPEIQTCVKNSAGTLCELRLSFSDHLAFKAQKAQAAPEIDTDSEFGDPFAAVGIPNQSQPLSGQAKQNDSHEAKRDQESALAKIFGIENAVNQQQQQQQQQQYSQYPDASPEDVAWLSDPEGEKETKEHSGKYSALLREFITTLESDLETPGSSQGSERDAANTADLIPILEAARKYLASGGTKGSKVVDGTGEASGSGTTPATDKSDFENVPAKDCAGDARPSSPEDSILFKSTAYPPTNLKHSDGDVHPEDIDVEEPEGQLLLDPHGSPSGKEVRQLQNQTGSSTITFLELDDGAQASTTGSETPTCPQNEVQTDETGGTGKDRKESGGAAAAPRGVPVTTDTPEDGDLSALVDILTAQLQQLDVVQDTLNDALRPREPTDKNHEDPAGATSYANRLAHIREEISTLKSSLRDTKGGMDSTLPPRSQTSLPSRISQSKGAMAKASSNSKGAGELVTGYVRSTRGLALEILAFQLIPVKASVLSKAVDLRVLKSLTLLNVGPQAPIWSLLARENKVQSLPLHTIQTDNVSTTLLTFVSQLDEVHNLVLLERDPKIRPKSLAPKTTCTMSSIRRLVLRRHAHTLRILSIRNLDSQDWDADEATIKLLSKRAKNLEELAISMNMQSIHTFLQFLPGFTSLLALHVVRLRNDDTCVWVMQETKKFIIDTLSHYPHLKLEYLAVDKGDYAEQISRVDVQKERESKKAKKKAKTAKSKGKQKVNTSPTPNAAAAPGGGNGIGIGIGGNVINSSNNNLAGMDFGGGGGFGPGPLFDPPSHGLYGPNPHTYNFHSMTQHPPTSGGSHKMDDDTDEDSESDWSNSEQPTRRTRLKRRSIRFSNIWYTTIFQKEIISGRL